MTLKRSYNRKLRLIGGHAAPTAAARGDYMAFQPSPDSDWRIRSLETGHVYDDRFPTKAAALDWIDERFHGIKPKRPIIRTMAVRCTVTCSPVWFGKVYLATALTDDTGFYPRLCVYIPHMTGDFKALPLDPVCFEPVNPAHRRRFKHLHLQGLEHVSGPVARVMSMLEHGALTLARDLPVPKNGRAA